VDVMVKCVPQALCCNTCKKLHLSMGDSQS
jgi:hypothetical protein